MIPVPLHVQDGLGEEHLCFFLHEVVERLDLSAFAAEYREEGPRPYVPALMVKVWLYAYCLQVTSSRRLEQRIKAGCALALPSTRSRKPKMLGHISISFAPRSSCHTNSQGGKGDRRRRPGEGFFTADS
jgi:transposase